MDYDIIRAFEYLEKVVGSQISVKDGMARLIDYCEKEVQTAILEKEPKVDMLARGNNYKKSWMQFCNKIGADYIEGGFLADDQVVATFGPWTIIFSIRKAYYGRGLTLRYTRVTALFVVKDHLQFKIYPKSLLSSLAQVIGIHNIKIGDSEFDQKFLLRGHDKPKIQALFTNQRIRELLQAQIPDWSKVDPYQYKIAPKPFYYFIKLGWFNPTFHLKTQPYKKGVSRLNFEQDTLIVGVQRLTSIYELFGEVLRQLCEIGVAVETNPDV